MSATFTIRRATAEDMPAMKAVMDLSISQLQDGFLSSDQVKASHAVMGIDTQLVKDQTYFVVESGNALAGCGGWSFRATLYGGDHSTDLRDPARLDPQTDAARVRAMYTHPEFTRRGVGRLILRTCEKDARAAGFKNAELMATLAGQPLYVACGYKPIEATQAVVGEVSIPLLRMGKALV